MADKAVDAHLFLAVAINALSHRPFDVFTYVHHLCYVAVARRALDAGFHVPLMREMHPSVPPEAVDTHPRRFLSRLCMRGELLDLRTLGVHVLVAHHALGDAWNSRRHRAVGTHMTREALHLVVDDVRFVWKCDRL